MMINILKIDKNFMKESLMLSSDKDKIYIKIVYMHLKLKMKQGRDLHGRKKF